MACINPTPEQLKQLMTHPSTDPIVMINLLKFKPDGGAESYGKYSEIAGPYIVGKLGGKIIYRGECVMTVIGEETWDEMIVVQYPSVDAFMEMQRDKAYQEAVPFRTDALLDSRLILTKNMDE